MMQAADDARKQYKFSEAIQILERASRLNPARSDIWLKLGGLYVETSDVPAAERCFEQALRAAKNKAETLTIAGRYCSEARHAGMATLAENFYRRAVKLPNASPLLYVQLAKTYELLRRGEDAAEMVEQALKKDKHCPEALLTCARLERQTGRIEAAEQTIRSFVTKPNPDFWVHAQTWYELGAILDRQGQYDEAFTAFVQAKTLLQPQSERFHSGLNFFRQRIQGLKTSLTAEQVQRWQATGQNFQPSRRLALLGGHPRSGTTLLEQVLDSHPGIISAEESQIFHFDTCGTLANRFAEDKPILEHLELAPLDLIQKLRASYFRYAELFLGQPVGDRLLIDKNPSLTFLIPILIRIFPEIKLLIALRDPRDVVLSCFMQPLPLGQANSAYLTLESTVAEYLSMMSLWRTLMPMLEGRYLQVRYEDMVADLESVARQTLDFLEVPWDARVLVFDEHARQKVVRSPTYADVTQPVYKRAVGRWRNYQKHLEPHLDKLEPFVKAFGYE